MLVWRFSIFIMVAAWQMHAMEHQIITYAR